MKLSVAIAIVLLSLACSAQEGRVPKLERMPEALERNLALSAAPPHLRAAATTYLLDPAKGYTWIGRGQMDSVASSSEAIGSLPRLFATTFSGRYVLTRKDRKRCCRTTCMPLNCERRAWMPARSTRRSHAVSKLSRRRIPSARVSRT